MILVLLVVVPFFIFFYMFWNSLKTDYLFFEPETWFFEPMWSNYTDVFEYSDLLSNVYNSLIISGFATIIGIICGLLTAYTIARYEMKKLALTILFTKQLPFITAIIPLWLMYKNIGLLNSHLGIILAHLVITIPFGVWIMVGFIEDIPKELEESAWIDGASRTQAFWKVIVLKYTWPGGNGHPLFHFPGIILCLLWFLEALMSVLLLFPFINTPILKPGSGQMMAAATLVTIPVFSSC